MKDERQYSEFKPPFAFTSKVAFELGRSAIQKPEWRLLTEPDIECHRLE